MLKPENIKRRADWRDDGGISSCKRVDALVNIKAVLILAVHVFRRREISDAARKENRAWMKNAKKNMFFILIFNFAQSLSGGKVEQTRFKSSEHEIFSFQRPTSVISLDCLEWDAVLQLKENLRNCGTSDGWFTWNITEVGILQRWL